jgi:hypothetical protein
MSTEGVDATVTKKYLLPALLHILTL